MSCMITSTTRSRSASDTRRSPDALTGRRRPPAHRSSAGSRSSKSVVAVGRPHTCLLVGSIRCVARRSVPVRQRSAPAPALEPRSKDRRQVQRCAIISQPRTAQQANGPPVAPSRRSSTSQHLRAEVGGMFPHQGAVPSATAAEQRRTDDGSATGSRQPIPTPVAAATTAPRRQSPDRVLHRTGHGGATHRRCPASSSQSMSRADRVGYPRPVLAVVKRVAVASSTVDRAGDPGRSPRWPIHRRRGPKSDPCRGRGEGAGYADAWSPVCGRTGGWPRRWSRCSETAGSWMVGPT